ncbi:MAG TPA: hypothetical protein VIF37_06445 [Methylobacter sp.]|jgi:hypothetical protein
MPDQDQNPGHHDGYAGEPGTYLLKDGERVAVDPVTLEPLPITKAAEEPAPEKAPLPAPEPVAEKPKPASKPAEKAVVDANKPE